MAGEAMIRAKAIGAAVNGKLVPVLWWCTPCGQWRKPKLLNHLGPMCPECGSGRMRPPKKGERVAV